MTKATVIWAFQQQTYLGRRMFLNLPRADQELIFPLFIRHVEACLKLGFEIDAEFIAEGVDYFTSGDLALELKEMEQGKPDDEDRKIRVYTATIMAFSKQHPGAPDGGVWVEDYPCLLLDRSIGDAAPKLEKFALERWPIENGWYGHRSAIMAATSTFYEILHRNIANGQLDSTGEGEGEDEDGRDFHFVPNPDELHGPLDLEIIGD